MSNNQSVAKTGANSAIKRFESTINSYEDHIQSLLASKRLDPNEFINSVINSVKRNPKLLECEQSTLFGAVLMSAELGLPPNTPHGLSWILPYNVNVGSSQNKRYESQAQFQIGYQGWIEIFNRHPAISQVDCNLVFENDEFKEVKGANPSLNHVPAESHTGKKRRGAYAIAWLKDKPHPVWVYMSAEEIMLIKSKSQGGGVAWKEENDPMGWMWMKSTIKQLAKKLPKTQEMRHAIYAQDTEDVGKPIKADGKTIQLDPVEDEKDRKAAQKEQSNAEVGEASSELFKTDGQK